MADQPQKVSIQPVIETDTALPLRSSKKVQVGQAIETDTAMPIRVSKSLTLRWAVEGAPIEVEVSATRPLVARRLTDDERDLANLISQLVAMFALAKGASPEFTVAVGILVWWLLREFSRRVTPD